MLKTILRGMVIQITAFLSMLAVTSLIAGVVWGLWGDYTLPTFGKIWAVLATSYLIIGNSKQ